MCALQTGKCVAILAAVLAISFGLSQQVAAETIVFGFGGAIDQETQLPKPWSLLGHPRADTPSFTVEDDPAQGMVLRMHAIKNQADGISHGADIDLAKTPFINFQWKVLRHPNGQIGTRKNDAAVKVQLDFGRGGRVSRRVLSYIFDPKAKAGVWHDDSSIVAKNRALVLDSGDENLNQWLARSRNVFEDYRRLYRSEPRPIQNVVVFCDSNDSDSEAIGLCAPISFSDAPLHSLDRGLRSKNSADAPTR
jgi:hypothetical protein